MVISPCTLDFKVKMTFFDSVISRDSIMLLALNLLQQDESDMINHTNFLIKSQKSFTIQLFLMHEPSFDLIADAN